MYLLLIFLSIIGSCLAGFFGRYLGSNGSAILTTSCLFISFLLSLLAFYEVGLARCFVYIKLCTWISSEVLHVDWGFMFDSLTVSMCVVVTFISFLVHLYSTEYMSHDPHLPRFMSYLSLFTFFMLILISADNFLQMFVGWEGVGLCSYLLINFWFTRIQANKAAIKAMILNRIGDFGLLIAILLIFINYKAVDYSTVAVVTPFFKTATISFLNFKINLLNTIGLFMFIGAVGKSAQLTLHTWLPDAMEGPTPVSALIHAATMVTAGVFLITRSSFIYEHTPNILEYVVIIGVLTSFFAATTGLLQNDLKRVIAYSTCSQLGYMVFACGLSNYSAGFFHLTNHAFFKALLFLGAGSVIHAVNDEQDMGRLTWYGLLTKSSCIRGEVYHSSKLNFNDFLSRAAVIDYSRKKSINKLEDPMLCPKHVLGGIVLKYLLIILYPFAYVRGKINAIWEQPQRVGFSTEFQSWKEACITSLKIALDPVNICTELYRIEGFQYRSEFRVMNRGKIKEGERLYLYRKNSTLARFPEDLPDLYPFREETHSHRIRKEALKLFSSYLNKINKSSRKIQKVFNEENFYRILVYYAIYVESCKIANSNFEKSLFPFRIISDPCFLLMAHAKLKTGVGPGLDYIPTQNVTLAGLFKLSKELKNQSIKCNPVRRVYIDKPGTVKKRPLGIPSIKDKVVQMAYKMVLEPLFEPTFLDQSHGFRPKRSCHTCLKQIFLKGRRTSWFIEMDLVKAFEKVNHKILIQEVKTLVNDFRITDVINKFLKAGYINIFDLADSQLEMEKGTSQGSIISPLLANIFFHRLDKFVIEKILPIYHEKRKVVINPEYRSAVLQYRVGNEWSKLYQEAKALAPHVSFDVIKKSIGAVRKREAGHNRIPSIIPQYRSLWYSRYADDILLGFRGTRKDANIILRLMAHGVEQTLLMTIHPEKSGVKHHSKGVLFLGYKLLGNYNAIFKWNEEKSKMTASNYIKFSIPQNKILKKLENRGYIQIGKRGKNTKYVGRRVDKWLFLESDYEIIQRFNSVTKGIANYYSGSFYPTPLITIYQLLRRSAALTLAHKHKQRTAKWAFEKWGYSLSVKIMIDKKGKEFLKSTKFFLPHVEKYTTPGTWKTGKDTSGSLESFSEILNVKGKYLPTSLSAIASLKELKCCIPNCPNDAEEWHHIKHRRKYKNKSKVSEIVRIALYSKQIPICKKHHGLIHNGKYDGPSLRKLPGFSL